MVRLFTSERYDLLVIGGGTAGLVGAKTAAGFGAKVLLVERDRPGGDCLWTGCIPSKSLLASAGAVAASTTASALGAHGDRIKIDFDAVMGHVDAAIQRIAPADSFEALEAAGVHVIHGQARFTGSNIATIDGSEIRFRQALVVTGATPTVPSIPGLAGVEAFTSETIWNMTTLPERLVVLGGGPIGCELGQAFARLGSKVTIMARAPRLLPHEDPDASSLVSESLIADRVDVRSGSEVVQIVSDGQFRSGTVTLGDGSAVEFDALLVAAGRTPCTQELGLEQVGVDLDDRGHIIVDEHLRTTNPWIWAAGDVTAYPQYTHLAGVHGSLAASNAILGVRRKVHMSAVPRVTFTAPEVAVVGTGTGSSGGSSKLRIICISHADLDRAITANETNGFTKLAIDGQGKIVGATVVGPRAGETLGELSLAVHRKLRTRDVASVTHAYPTYNDAVWNAAVADVRRDLATPVMRCVTGTAASLRRLWVTLRQLRTR